MKHPDEHAIFSCEPDKEETPPPMGRREERDTEYRRRILSAAKTLLATHAIDSVTMHQIAKESGVGQGILYRRYTHIGDVCSDLFKSTMVRFIESMEIKYSANTLPGTGLEKLSACIHDAIDFIDANVSLLSVISTMHLEKHRYIIYKKPIFIRLHNLIVPLFEQAIQQGEMKEMDVTLATNTLLISLFPDQYLYHKDVLGYSKQQYTEGICQLFLKGV
ncbi:TetR/AcrR family transcriptional regulator [Paenibacillus roseipurpureus]|uniref:TetR/AcrR family transcriptional regulator n=1 Tax=Paenibacillus roseopurpureus TaxID=2918901 RepID=A0AA96LS69_9BACL|nr:TetR/AcrR family transcriptional regulator [Paenibacillus sp. MBLB1832]WNR46242.1 TetR/AcrR family transcriptional regulator [Paenibacillus sp. MBLB1832]